MNSDRIKFSLDNDLRVVALPNNSSSIVRISVVVKAGKVYEPRDKRGISHLVEHILFMGSKNYPSPFLLNEATSSHGGSKSAATYSDSVIYGITLPKEHIKDGLIFIQQLLNPSYTDKYIEFAKKIVCNEISEKFSNFWDFWYSNLLGINNFKSLGDPLIITNITKDELINFFNKYYVPQNIVIGISGGFNQDELPSMLPEFLSSIQNNPLVIDDINMHSLFSPKNRVLNLPTSSDLDGILYGFYLPLGDQNKNRVLLGLVRNILCNPDGSRLYDKLIINNGFARHVYGDIILYADSMEFHLRGSFVRGHLEEISSAIINELDNLKSELISDDELERAKEFYKLEKKLLLENQELLSEQIAIDELFNLIPRAEEFVNYIEAVTSEDIKLFVQDNLTRENSVMLFQTSDK